MSENCDINATIKGERPALEENLAVTSNSPSFEYQAHLDNIDDKKDDRLSESCDKDTGIQRKFDVTSHHLNDTTRKPEIDQMSNDIEVNDDFTDSDPVLLWTTIRPWAALNISCWDFLCDKARVAEYPNHSTKKGNYTLRSQTYKIQVCNRDETSFTISMFFF